MKYQFDINDRAFNAIKNKTKRIEIRANKKNSKEDYSKIKKHDIIKFTNSNNEIITCKVLDNVWYPSIEELLTLEGTKYTLSSTNNYQEGIKSINNLNGYKEAIKESGVYAIHIKYLYCDNTIWEDLYQIAATTNNPNSTPFIDYGGVSAVILTEDDNIYTGVCIDTACSLGMCAERNAISSMLTNNETIIKKLVCLNKNGEPMLPCGSCRELMMQLSKESNKVEILIDKDLNKVITLEELIPNWWGIARHE